MSENIVYVCLAYGSIYNTVCSLRKRVNFSYVRVKRKLPLSNIWRHRRCAFVCRCEAQSNALFPFFSSRLDPQYPVKLVYTIQDPLLYVESRLVCVGRTYRVVIFLSSPPHPLLIEDFFGTGTFFSPPLFGQPQYFFRVFLATCHLFRAVAFYYWGFFLVR